MKKIIINDREKGLLFHNGRFVGVRGAGKYRLRRGQEMEVLTVDLAVTTPKATADVLLANETFRAETVPVSVPDGHIALCFRGGHLVFVLQAAAAPHIFWRAAGAYTFRLVDINDPFVPEDIPATLFASIHAGYYTKVEVPPYCRGRLSVDNRPARLLEPGTYYFWKGPKKVACDIVDTRLCALELVGQEMLSRDKVTLRLNFLCHYRVTDCERIASELDNYIEHLHTAAQLALREYVGAHTLDELLADKEAISRFTYERLAEKAPSLYLTVTDAAVKDIILPGDIREIMNTVLLAEKRAQANVITRREEVASTRSLLNTAKLMEENPTLARLKEMECIERICENVGNINLNGSSDILAQLVGLLHKPA